MADAECSGIRPMFSRMFPGVLLREFLYWPARGPQHPAQTLTVYEGHEGDLVHFDLLRPDMLAVRPKRIRHSAEAPDQNWSFATARIARGQVNVRIVNVPPFLPVLAPFGPDHWPWFETHEQLKAFARGRLMESVTSHADQLVGRIMAHDDESRILKSCGLRWEPGAHKRIEDLARRFAAELRRRVREADLQSTTRPKLEVIHGGRA